MNLSIDAEMDIIKDYVFPQNLIHLANEGSGGLFTPLLVSTIIILAIWSMRDNDVEVQRSVTAGLLIGFVISLFFVALKEIPVAYVTTVGILFVISLLYQKQSDN